MILKKKTKLGTLMASYKPDKVDYPGFYIDLWRKDKPIQPICNIEYDPNKECIQVIVYGDGTSEEPTSITEVKLFD